MGSLLKNLQGGNQDLGEAEFLSGGPRAEALPNSFRLLAEFSSLGWKTEVPISLLMVNMGAALNFLKLPAFLINVVPFIFEPIQSCTGTWNPSSASNFSDLSVFKCSWD